jgi:hypothetical protein
MKYDDQTISKEQYEKLSQSLAKSGSIDTTSNPIDTTSNPIDATATNKKMVDNDIIHSENTKYAPIEMAEVGNIHSGEGMHINPTTDLPPTNDKKTEEPNGIKSETTALPSKHSESDNDDQYKIKIDHELTEIKGNEPTEEAAMESAAECAISERTVMGEDNRDAIWLNLLKWMGLIAGGFIIIIATAYRGREPPMDDDDFEDIENKLPGR